MSTVSGLASKADKEKGSKQKYSSLNINNIFKGKSLENTKTVEQTKHGLQTLGKIGAGRRVPPPANLPSLKSETTGKNTTTITNASTNLTNNNTTSGNQRWAKKDQQENITSTQNTSNSSNQIEQQNSNYSTVEQNGQLTDSNNSTQSTVNVNNTSQSKTWNNVQQQQQQQQQQQPTQQQQTTDINEQPDTSSTNKKSIVNSKFSNEFPSLDYVSNVQNVQKLNSESYGPGPNLRPQTGNWLNKQQQGNQHPNNGNFDREYANGQQQDSFNQQDDNQQRAYNTAQSRNLNKSNGYQRNPNFQPQRFNNQQQQQQRPYDNRNRHNNRIREDMPERAKVAILSQKELKGFDELLDDSKLDDWTKTKTQIDFNAKLNFSEDEETRSLDEFNNEKSEFKESRDESNANLDNRSTKPLNEPQQNSRYRRDYQNPRPHQSYNSSNSNKTYERNNYVQQSNQLNKSDNLVDDDKRIKLRSDLNDRRRDDDDRKYQQKPLDERNKSLDQPQEQLIDDKRDQGRNYNNNRNNDNYNNNNNRQFQQSLPPRFQKLQQNNNSSNYNRNDQQQQSRDRKRTDSLDSTADDDYQNKRILNRQTSWRNNRELSRSQDKAQQVMNKDESIKKSDDNQSVPLATKSAESESIKPSSENNESKLSDLDLKASANSSLNKNLDDKKDVTGGDNLSNDLSQLSISKSLEKPATVAKEEDKQSSKQLNASQESKHSELNQSQNQNKSQDQHQAYKKDNYNSRNNNINRNNNYDRMRSDDQHYRYQQQRDYRGARQNDGKLNKNDLMDNRRPKKHMDYVDDFRNDYRNNRNDYNQSNRSNKYDVKKDDKYGNQQQRPNAPGGNKYSESTVKETAAKDLKKPTVSTNKELNSSQNDKFDKDKKLQQLQNRYKDQQRKPDQLDDSTSSGYLPNKKQLGYNKHDNKQKMSNYDRKTDNLNRNPQQRKLSQEEEPIDKVIKSSQEDTKKTSTIKENVDQKSKTEETKAKADLELSTSIHYEKDKTESDSSKLDFAFNSKPANTTVTSKIVGASRNVGDQLSQCSPSTDDLNMKIASVKNVWESMPSMPSVLENINNEDNLPVVNQLDHKYDESKLRSPSVRSVDQNTAASVHVLSTINSSNNSNNSSFAFTNSMKPLTSDDLKKSHQQQLYQQHNSNQLPHQLNPQQQQHQVLISTSPPNLMNHMNPANLDNVRRVQTQYQLSNLQRISSPSNLIYNSQAQVGAPGSQPPPNVVGPPNPAANVNIYKQLMQHNTLIAQFQQAQQPTAHHFAAQHILQQQHQRNQLGQQNQPMFVPAQVAPQLQQQLGPPQQMLNPSNSGQPVNPSNDFRFNQQNIAASHLINLNKQHYVQSQTMHGQPMQPMQAPPQLGPSPQAGVPQPQSVQPPAAFYQNQNLQNVNAKSAYGYGPQAHQLPPQQMTPSNQPGHVLAGQPPNPQYNYITSQQFNMMNAQNQQQLANAQNYRNQKRFI